MELTGITPFERELVAHWKADGATVCEVAAKLRARRERVAAAVAPEGAGPRLLAQAIAGSSRRRSPKRE